MRCRWSVFLLALKKMGFLDIFPIHSKKYNTENSVGPLLSLLWRGPVQEDGMDGPSSPRDKGRCGSPAGGGVEMAEEIMGVAKANFSYEQCPKQLTKDGKEANLSRLEVATEVTYLWI